MKELKQLGSSSPVKFTWGFSKATMKYELNGAPGLCGHPVSIHSPHGKEHDSPVNTWEVGVLPEGYVFTREVASVTSSTLHHCHTFPSGRTQNALDRLMASTRSLPSHLAASGTASGTAPCNHKTQPHRSSPWPSEALSKGRVREANEGRATLHSAQNLAGDGD